jgi:hypothetical protein
MLFDLRGRGRRRTVQVIYLFLAIILGGGLVLFGVGGATSGGLLDAITGGSSNTGTDTYVKRVETAQKRVTAQPTSLIAWRDLTRADYQLAGIGENFDATTGTFTASGMAQLRKADAAWQHYLKLVGEDGKADAALASQMVQAYDSTALNQPAKAVTAIEYVLDSQPQSAGLYAKLAVYAYQAGQTRKGDLASAKAISLSSTDQRATLKAQLDAAKQAATGATAGATSGAGGAVTTATG